MKVLGLIPARGGSKGIPKKNIKPFFGKPLINWTIEQALSTKLINRVLVSTDDEEIANISKKAGADVPFLRPKKLSSDTSPTIETIIHALKNLEEFDEVIILQPTSPLRSVKDIESVFHLKKIQREESIVSISQSSKHPSWTYCLDNSNKMIRFDASSNYTRRQDFPVTYFLNGAIYLCTREFVFREKSLINENTVGYIMPPERSIDIDSELDFKIAEFLKKSNFS